MEGGLKFRCCKILEGKSGSKFRHGGGGYQNGQKQIWRLLWTDPYIKSCNFTPLPKWCSLVLPKGKFCINYNLPVCNCPLMNYLLLNGPCSMSTQGTKWNSRRSGSRKCRFKHFNWDSSILNIRYSRWLNISIVSSETKHTNSFCFIIRSRYIVGRVRLCNTDLITVKWWQFVVCLAS